MKTARLNAAGLLAGILAGFALAVFLGHEAATYSKPSKFVRFHRWTDPEGIFYPPFRMLEHLALNRWRPGQTVVIVAGNSIFNGFSQPAEEIWSRHLQEILGPEKYVVVNLAFVGGRPAEGGMLVAESLLRRGIPVLVVANSGLQPPESPIDGTYGYYYWEAAAQSALLPYPARDAGLAARVAEMSEADRRKQAEQRRAAALNAHLYFQELWHHVALRYVFTVWSHLAGGEFWQPRDSWPDPEDGPKPLATRFRDHVDDEMKIVRGLAAANTTPSADGRWEFAPARAREVSEHIAAAFVPRLRPHLLMVLCENAPFYRTLLAPDEQARDLAAFEGCAAVWRHEGIACLVAGLDFENADYHDRAHLTPSGGRKLATLVAAEVKKLSPETTRP